MKCMQNAVPMLLQIFDYNNILNPFIFFAKTR